MTIHKLIVTVLTHCAVFAGTLAPVGASLGEVQSSPCTGTVTTAYATPLGVFRIYNQYAGPQNWACLEERSLAKTTATDTNGIYHSFGAMCVSCFDFVLDGKRAARQNGRPLIRRAVLVETRHQENDNQYYLLDFRAKAPLVVGPFGSHEASEAPTVIWSDRSVIVVLDNQEVQWPPGPRYIERNEKGEGSYEVDDEGTPIPHINRDGKLLGKDGKPRTYPLGVCYIAFVYDYDQQKLYKAYIDE